MKPSRKILIGAAIAAGILVCTALCVILADRSASGMDPYRVPHLLSITPDLKSREAELKAKLVKDDSCYFDIGDDGSLSFHTGQSFTDGKAFEMTDAQAEVFAKDTLKGLGLLPDGDYRIRIERMESQIPEHGGSAEKPVTVEITVLFLRTFRGIDVMCREDNGISVTIVKDGLAELRYLWRDMELRDIDNDGKEPLSSDSALTVYRDNWDTIHGSCCDPNPEPVIKQAYFQRGDICRPAWVICDNEEYLNAVYIDMFTGELLYG